jgi:hypothetical protein
VLGRYRRVFIDGGVSELRVEATDVLGNGLGNKGISVRANLNVPRLNMTKHRGSELTIIFVSVSRQSTLKSVIGNAPTMFFHIGSQPP